MRAAHLVIAALGVFVLVALLTVRTAVECFDVRQRQKVVWILWLQGWDAAPQLVRNVRRSWERLNPGWTVRALDAANLPAYLDQQALQVVDRIGFPAGKSDVVRLSLLNAHGGVWADATMLCMRPLDAYIYDGLEPSGFWMYHGQDGRGGCTGPAIWFMASVRGSTIARKWYAGALRYWEDRTHTDDYFWTDHLFADLYRSDPEFAASWDRVPHVCCEDPGSAHALAGRVLGWDPDVHELVRARAPFALKLSHHGSPADLTHTNADAVMSMSLPAAAEGNEKLQPAKTDASKDAWPSALVVVLSDCGHELDAALALCRERGAFAMVYDKCSFCTYVDGDDGHARCRPLPNVGRESHTFLHFIVRYYDNLPDEMVLSAGNMSKHNRLGRLRYMLEHPGEPCYYINDHLVEFDGEMILNDWGEKLAPASVRPFRSWFERFVGPWSSVSQRKVCWNGMIRTTRALVRRQPVEFYGALLTELEAGGSAPEAAHFFERSMVALFA